MWDTIREWGLAVLAVLGAVFAPISYVMGIRSDILVLRAEFEALKKQQEMEIKSLKGDNEILRQWLIRVEEKLDKVLMRN